MKKIIAVILSIMMTFSLILTGCLFVINYVVLNADFYTNIIDKNGVYSEIYNDINSQIKNELIKNNVVVTDNYNFISEEECKNLINQNLENVFSYLKGTSNNVSKLDLAQYEKNANIYIDNYLNENGIVSNNLINSVKENLNNSVSNIIRNNVDVMFINRIVSSSMFSKVRVITTIFYRYLIYACIATDIFLIAAIFIIFARNSIKKFSYLSNSFLISGLFLDIVFFSGFLCENYRNAPIFPEYLKKLLGNVIGQCFIYITLSGCIIMVIGIIIKAIQISLSSKLNRVTTL